MHALPLSSLAAELAGSIVGRSTAWLLLGFAVAYLARRRAASRRHLVWAATLVGLLALGAAHLGVEGLALPRWTLAILPAAAPGAAAAADREIEATGPGGEVANAGLSRPAGEGPPGTTLRPSTDGDALSRAGAARLYARRAYLAGVGLVLLYFSCGLFRVARISRAATPLEEAPSWRRSLAALPEARRTKLRASSALNVPVTWGFVHPTTLVPAEANGWSAELRRQVLLHELAHVDRFDWLLQLAARIVCALFWWQPLAWVATRRLLLEAERSCDDRVLLAGVEGDDYAEQLCRLARGIRRDRRPLAALALTSRSHLSRRIGSILKHHERRSTVTRTRLFSCLLLTLVPALLLGALGLAPRDLGADGTGSAEISPLVAAALEGDSGELSRLIAAGIDVNAADPRRGRSDARPRTALAAAAGAGHLSAVELLLQAGARVEAAPDGEMSALMQAANGGHTTIVDRLVAAGATLDRRIDGDGTALIAAARRGQRETVEQLLGMGADPDRGVDGDGTPLLAAVHGRDPEVARALLEAGADPDRTLDRDESPLMAAIDSGDAAIVELLLEWGANADTTISGDGSALIRAADRGDGAAIEALLDAGADPDLAVHGDGTPLIGAAAQGELEAMRRLLAAGADVDAGIEGDGNPLIAAAREGRLEATRLLIEHGADIERIVPGDENALISASASGQLEVVRYLIERGADVEVEVLANGREIRTALNQADRYGHADVARLLRSAGARK